MAVRVVADRDWLRGLLDRLALQVRVGVPEKVLEARRLPLGLVVQEREKVRLLEKESLALGGVGVADGVGVLDRDWVTEAVMELPLGLQLPDWVRVRDTVRDPAVTEGDVQVSVGVVERVRVGARETLLDGDVLRVLVEEAEGREGEGVPLELDDGVALALRVERESEPVGLRLYVLVGLSLKVPVGDGVLVYD